MYVWTRSRLMLKKKKKKLKKVPIKAREFYFCPIFF